MPYKVHPSTTIQRLSNEVTAKLQLLDQLEDERARLCTRHALLECTCTCLSLMANSARLLEPAPFADDKLCLLQQLEGTMWGPQAVIRMPVNTAANRQHQIGKPSNGQSTEKPALGVGLEALTAVGKRDVAHVAICARIAPEHSPLQWMLRLINAQQQQAGSLHEAAGATAAAQPYTVQQLRANYCNSMGAVAAAAGVTLEGQQRHRQVFSSSMLLNPADSAAVAIQCAFIRHWHGLTSLLLAGRGDIAIDFTTSDAVTGERIEQRNLKLYRKVAEQLQLSCQQQQSIVTRLQFFKEQQRPVNELRQRLQWELLQCSTAITATQAGQTEAPLHAAGAGAGAAAHAGAGAAASATAATPFAHSAAHATGGVFQRQRAVLLQQERWRQHEQQQQRLLQQLHKVLRKEYTMVYCAYVAIEGCLTWKQLAQVGGGSHWMCWWSVSCKPGS